MAFVTCFFFWTTIKIGTICHTLLCPGVFVRGSIPHRYLALPMSSSIVHSTGRKASQPKQDALGPVAVVMLRAGCYTSDAQ